MVDVLDLSNKPTAGRREIRKREVRGRIIEAAIAVFSEKTLDEVTVDEICELADVARKTFYNYYPSKQHILEELSQSLMVAESNNNFELAMEKYNNTSDRLDFIFNRMAENMSQYETLERNLVLHAMFDLSENTGKSGEKLENVNRVFEELLKQGVKLGDVSKKYNTRFLAEMVAGSINAVVMNWIHQPEYPLKRRVKELKGFIVEMVLIENKNS